jgi:hypothetical protein
MKIRAFRIIRFHAIFDSCDCMLSMKTDRNALCSYSSESAAVQHILPKYCLQRTVYPLLIRGSLFESIWFCATTAKPNAIWRTSLRGAPVLCPRRDPAVQVH